LYNSQGIKFI